MNLRNADTRNVVEASIELAKRTRGVQWDRINLGRDRRWANLAEIGAWGEQFEEELRDAADARAARKEADERGARPLSVVKKELGL